MELMSNGLGGEDVEEREAGAGVGRATQVEERGEHGSEVSLAVAWE